MLGIWSKELSVLVSIQIWPLHKHWTFITSSYSLDDEYQNNMKLENFPTLWITVVLFIFHKQWNYTQKILLFFNVKENNQSMLLYLWNMHIKSMLCFFYSTNFTTKINLIPQHLMHFNKIKFLTFLSKNIQFDSIKDCFIFQTEFLKKKIYQKLMLTYCLYAVVQVYTMHAVSPQLSNILRNFGYLQYNTHTHFSKQSSYQN